MPTTPSKFVRSRKSSKAGDAAPPVAPTSVLGSVSDPPAGDSPTFTNESNLRANSILSHAGAFQEPPDRWAMIAVAAYFLAERRGFAAGYEHEDWFAAEREVDAALAKPPQ